MIGFPGPILGRIVFPTITEDDLWQIQPQRK